MTKVKHLQQILDTPKLGRIFLPDAGLEIKEMDKNFYLSHLEKDLEQYQHHLEHDVIKEYIPGDDDPKVHEELKKLNQHLKDAVASCKKITGGK